MSQSSRYKDASGKIHQIEYGDQPIAKGGAGEVYLTTDNQWAVKVYLKDTPPMGELEYILKVAPRENHKLNQYLAWPIGILLDDAQRNPIGVVMPNVQKNNWMVQAIWYRNFKLLNTLKKNHPERVGTFKGRVDAARCIAAAATYLNRTGHGHSDFSGKNVFINPVMGIGVLIDLDGIMVNAEHMTPKMWGTEGYAAPELYTSDLKLPDTYSDRHALAVVLYELLLQGHPLRGIRPPLHDDIDTDEKLQLGAYALYREHSTDRSNRAKGNVPLSSILGEKMANLFRRSFEDGVNYQGWRSNLSTCPRPHPDEYEVALGELSDDLVKCSNSTCIWGYFPSQGGTVEYCPACGTKAPEIVLGWVSVVHSAANKGGWYPLKSQQTHKLLFDCQLTGAQIFGDGNKRSIIQIKPVKNTNFDCRFDDKSLICQIIQPNGDTHTLDAGKLHTIGSDTLLRLSHKMHTNSTLLRISQKQNIVW